MDSHPHRKRCQPWPTTHILRQRRLPRRGDRLHDHYRLCACHVE